LGKKNVFFLQNLDACEKKKKLTFSFFPLKPLQIKKIHL